jgi:opacity protein-like surface antigen
MARVVLLVVFLVLTVLTRPASADLTGFLGTNTSVDARMVRGAAFGAGLLVLGFEFEYANNGENPLKAAPALTTGMGNVLVQTPVEFLRMQPYFTTGAGLYRERLGNRRDTGFGFNTGGGVKIALAGPLRVRLDYRVFRLGDDAVASPAHRVYAGLNLRF